LGIGVPFAACECPRFRDKRSSLVTKQGWAERYQHMTLGSLQSQRGACFSPSHCVAILIHRGRNPQAMRSPSPSPLTRHPPSPHSPAGSGVAPATPWRWRRPGSPPPPRPWGSWPSSSSSPRTTSGRPARTAGTPLGMPSTVSSPHPPVITPQRSSPAFASCRPDDNLCMKCYLHLFLNKTFSPTPNFHDDVSYSVILMLDGRTPAAPRHRGTGVVLPSVSAPAGVHRPPPHGAGGARRGGRGRWAPARRPGSFRHWRPGTRSNPPALSECAGSGPTLAAACWRLGERGAGGGDEQGGGSLLHTHTRRNRSLAGPPPPANQPRHLTTRWCCCGASTSACPRPGMAATPPPGEL